MAKGHCSKIQDRRVWQVDAANLKRLLFVPPHKRTQFKVL